MRPILHDRLDYLWRTVNPNYLIIVQNQINKEMNFANLRPVIPEARQRYKPQPRYEIKHYEEDGVFTIIVLDSFSNNKEVCKVTCPDEKFHKFMEKIQGQYKGAELIDKI